MNTRRNRRPIPQLNQLMDESSHKRTMGVFIGTVDTEEFRGTWSVFQRSE